MSQSSNYLDSLVYEDFIKLADTSNPHYELTSAKLKNLMDYEDGKMLLPMYNPKKDLADMKRELKSAAKAAQLRNDIAKDDKDKLKSIWLKFGQANTSASILEACKEAIALLVKDKPKES